MKENQRMTWNNCLRAAALLMTLAVVLQGTVYAAAAGDIDVPYEGELVTGTGEPGINHTASVCLTDETGEYPEDSIRLTFEDVTGAHSKTVSISDYYYASGFTYNIYLVAPGTFTVTSDVADGYMIVDSATGEEFAQYEAEEPFNMLFLSIRSDGKEEPADSVLLEDRDSVTAGETYDAEGENVYVEFLNTISFIETDETWEKTIHLRQIKEPAYDYAIPDGAYGKKDYESLSEFDRFIYAYTYCAFSVAKQSPTGSWETQLKSPEAFAGIYSDLLTFEDTQGADSYNRLEEVNSAFQKLWDWQYQYAQEHNEPYDFIDKRAYSEMRPVNESSEAVSESESLSEQDLKVIEEILNELDESDRKEIQQAAEQELKAQNADGVESSAAGIIVPVLIVLAVAVLIAVLIFAGKKKGSTR